MFRLVWVYLGHLDMGGCTLGISWVGPFLGKTAILWTETRLFSLEAQRLDDKTGHTRRPRLTSDQLFPSLARPDLAVFRPELAEIGPSLHPDDGKRRHVRESISLSSQTAPPDSQRDPPDPPRPPQESLEKFVICLQKSVGRTTASCNLLAVTRCRFAAAGDGSQC